MVLKLWIDLPEDPLTLRKVRSHVRHLLDGMDVDEEDIHSVETILGELGMNVIMHARTPIQRYQIELDYRHGELVLTVADNGVGFRAEGLAAPGTERPSWEGWGEDAGEIRVGGFGLPLVQSLAEKYAHTAGHDGLGTRIKVYKTLRYRLEDEKL